MRLVHRRNPVLLDEFRNAEKPLTKILIERIEFAHHAAI